MTLDIAKLTFDKNWSECDSGATWGKWKSLKSKWQMSSAADSHGTLLNAQNYIFITVKYNFVKTKKNLEFQDS